MRNLTGKMICAVLCFGTLSIHPSHGMDETEGKPRPASVQKSAMQSRDVESAMVVDWVDRTPSRTAAGTASVAPSSSRFRFLCEPSFWWKATAVAGVTGVGVLTYYLTKGQTPSEPDSDPLCDVFMNGTKIFLSHMVHFSDSLSEKAGDYFCRMGTFGYGSPLSNKGCCTFLEGDVIEESREFMIGQVWDAVTLASEEAKGRIRHVFGLEQTPYCPPYYGG